MAKSQRMYVVRIRTRLVRKRTRLVRKRTSGLLLYSYSLLISLRIYGWTGSSGVRSGGTLIVDI